MYIRHINQKCANKTTYKVTYDSASSLCVLFLHVHYVLVASAVPFTHMSTYGVYYT